MFETRAITLEDVNGMEFAKAPVSVISRMRDSHHSVARQLALGKSVPEVSLITGYAPQTIAGLKNDASFQELLQFYRDQVDIAFVNTVERIASLANDTVQELHTRLVEKPESFTNGQLNELLKTTADRSGHGPSSSHQVDVRHVLDPDTIQRIKENAKQPKVLRIEDAQKNLRPAGNVIDVEAEPLQESHTRDASIGEGV